MGLTFEEGLRNRVDEGYFFDTVDLEEVVELLDDRDVRIEVLVELLSLFIGNRNCVFSFDDLVKIQSVLQRELPEKFKIVWSDSEHYIEMVSGE